MLCFTQIKVNNIKKIDIFMIISMPAADQT